MHISPPSLVTESDDKVEDGPSIPNLIHYRLQKAQVLWLTGVQGGNSSPLVWHEEAKFLQRTGFKIMHYVVMKNITLNWKLSAENDQINHLNRQFIPQSCIRQPFDLI